jgi:predicted enzyme related to lactoylglutathione lyase
MTEQQTEPTQQQTYPVGTPIWNDVSAPDAAAARAFYTSLFGWDVFVNPDEQYGGYGMFLQDGKQVAGVGPTMDEHQPAAWTMYVLTENAEAVAAKVTAAGGQVVVPPMTVGPNGTMAIFIDPSGASLGVWQPGTHKGAELFHRPGSVAWNELHSRDIGASSRFYAEVFGWEAERSPFGDVEYTMWKLDGRGVAGGIPHGRVTPAEVTPGWFAYFSVQNCDAMVARAQELGATVLAEPVRSEDGLYSVLRDPQGAVFGVISP